MSDEFDDVFDRRVARLRRGARRVDEHGHSPDVPRLMTRLYRNAEEPLRNRMLRCLVRPLGPLGLAAIASGAFVQLLHRGGERSSELSLDSLGRHSNDQVLELVRFVQQVSPEAIQQVTSLLADTPVGTTAFTAAVAVLLALLAMGSAVEGGSSSSAVADAWPQGGHGDDVA